MSEPSHYNLDIIEREDIRVIQLQSRSEAAQEVISRKSGFVERFSLIIFIIIIGLLFVAACFIRYPDVIYARAELMAENGPKEIVPLQSGRLIKLFVQNGQFIKKGDVIGWIESSSAPNEVLQLSEALHQSESYIDEEKEGMILSLFSGRFRNLGSIQTDYQTFISALTVFNDYLKNGFYFSKKDMILNDISSITKMNSALEKQKDLTVKDNSLSAQTFRMNKKLYDEKVISLKEFRAAQSEQLNKQMEIPEINSKILSNENVKRDKQKELQQLTHDFSQQRVIFQQALQTLISEVNDWKRNYILTSPVDGTVYFNFPLQQNKFIQQGKLLGYISPLTSIYYAQLYLPQSNLGKVDTGMKVRLRLDAYPYEENGVLIGKLNYISKVSTDSGYLANVALSPSLMTNYNYKINYKDGLKAQAMVITKNASVLQRIYYGLVKKTSVN